MIKNFNSLANTEVKKKALKILDAGLTAAQPKNFLKEFVKKNYIQTGKNRIILSDYKKNFCGRLWEGCRLYGRICVK